MNAAGNGIVDIFDLEGNFVKRFASNGMLNSPWGVTQASASFGQFSNDILIGNFGDGTINAFDPTSGTFLGQLKDQAGAGITNTSLWGLVFGAGGTGDSNTLYFTAGLAHEGHGLFGAITAAASPELDFSVAATPQSATVAAGEAAHFTLTIAPANGFADTVALSCAAPTGVACTLDPPTVNPGSGAATSIMTVTTSVSLPPSARLNATARRPAGVGLLGFLFVGRGGQRRGLVFSSVVLLHGPLIAGSLLVSTGCGGAAAGRRIVEPPRLL